MVSFLQAPSFNLSVDQSRKDLHARGYSDGPQLKYDNMLYAGQLKLLLDYITWSKVLPIGFSLVRP